MWRHLLAATLHHNDKISISYHKIGLVSSRGVASGGTGVSELCKGNLAHFQYTAVFLYGIKISENNVLEARYRAVDVFAWVI